MHLRTLGSKKGWGNSAILASVGLGTDRDVIKKRYWRKETKKKRKWE